MELYKKYITELTTFYSVSKLSTTLKIRGNPDFLQLTSPKMVKHSTPFTNVASYEAEINSWREQIINSCFNGELYSGYMLSNPLYSKINILMPSDPTFGNNTNTVGENGSFVSFWYTGYYWVREIEHELSNGNFEQTLHLNAITVMKEQ
jgi:hypothetical protein